MTNHDLAKSLAARDMLAGSEWYPITAIEREFIINALRAQPEAASMDDPVAWMDESDNFNLIDANTLNRWKANGWHKDIWHKFTVPLYRK